MANFFRIRNFERFQHYKDRNPPWIRLYGALWRDRAFFRLPDAVKAHLIGLFALAARLDNRIPDDPEWLAHELCASEPIDFGALLASGFLVPLARRRRTAIGPIAALSLNLICPARKLNQGSPRTPVAASQEIVKAAPDKRWARKSASKAWGRTGRRRRSGAEVSGRR